MGIVELTGEIVAKHPDENAVAVAPDAANVSAYAAFVGAGRQFELAGVGLARAPASPR